MILNRCQSYTDVLSENNLFFLHDLSQDYPALCFFSFASWIRQAQLKEARLPAAVMQLFPSAPSLTTEPENKKRRRL